jgi:ribosomal-protein-alanine N-acetyltransferase
LPRGIARGSGAGGLAAGEYDRNAMEFFRSKLESDAQRYDGWLGWYVVTRDATPTLIAGAGFLGPPEDGTVEIGYSVVAEARGAGYATEIVEALVRRAFESDSVQRVVAETATTNEASQRVLERNGFTPAGSGRDASSLRFQKSR